MTEPALDYEKVSKIGEGQYGVVYKARNVATNELVALKRINIDDRDGIPSTALREISVIRSLNHDNIVKLLDVLFAETKFYLVFELAEMDLGQFIRQYKPELVPFDISKNIFKQLISGLFFCHSRRVLHRDIKPQNILVNADYVVKIADFGLARAFTVPLRPLTNEVVTLWYRPPEVLFGDDFYSMGVDIWSSGCILAELLLGRAPFQGDSEIGQIHEIFKQLGTPDDDSWPGISENKIFRTTFPSWVRKSKEELFPDVAEDAALVLDRIFVYDQEKRMSANDILNSNYIQCCDEIDALPSQSMSQ